MAFQLFVDPTAGARQASDHIMSAAGDIADRIKDERQKKKDETKLFEADVVTAASLGLGEGDNLDARIKNLKQNTTPSTIKGLLQGTMTKTEQDQKQAQIDATNATAAATREATSQSQEMRATTLEIQREQLNNLVGQGLLTQKEVDSFDGKQKLLEDKTRSEIEASDAASAGARQRTKLTQKEVESFDSKKKLLEDKTRSEIDASRSTVTLNEQRVANEKQRTKIYGDSVRNEALKAQNEKARIANQKQEQDRLDRIAAIPKGKMEQAFDSSTGKAIPGIYVTQKGEVFPLETDMASMSPEKRELSRLKGALKMLEQLNDDDLVDVDGGNQLKDLAPVGWWGSLLSSGDQKASLVRARVQGAITKLESAGIDGSTRKVTVRKGPDGKTVLGPDGKPILDWSN